MAEIKDLEKNKDTHSKIYNHTTEILDMVTGEVARKQRAFIKKEKTKDSFIKLFVENLFFVSEELSNNALRILIVIIKDINYQNIFKYNKELLNYFTSKKILSKASFYRGFKELIEKKILIKIDDEKIQNELEIYTSDAYFINPNIIGRGSFRELQKLRQTITKTFDFEKLEFTQEYGIETFYDGYKDLQKNPENYQIEGIKQEKKENLDEIDVIFSKKDQEIVDKNRKKEDNRTIVSGQKKDDEYTEEEMELINLGVAPPRIEKEIEKFEAEERILALKNKNLELEKEKIEAENERMRLEIELLKLKKK